VLREELAGVAGRDGGSATLPGAACRRPRSAGGRRCQRPTGCRGGEAGREGGVGGVVRSGGRGGGQSEDDRGADGERQHDQEDQHRAGRRGWSQGPVPGPGAAGRPRSGAWGGVACEGSRWTTRWRSPLRPPAPGSPWPRRRRAPPSGKPSGRREVDRWSRGRGPRRRDRRSRRGRAAGAGRRRVAVLVAGDPGGDGDLVAEVAAAGAVPPRARRCCRARSRRGSVPAIVARTRLSVVATSAARRRPR
jgi:hypothetical protein